MNRQKTAISTTEVAFITGINPWALAGFCSCPEDTSTTISRCCGGSTSDWLEYMGDSRRLTREDLFRALHSAEQEIAELTGHYPAPQQVLGEGHEYAYDRHPRRKDGRLMHIRTHYRHVADVGIQSAAKIGDAASVTRTGRTWTASITTTTAPTTRRFEVRHVTASLDGADAALYPIRPVEVQVQQSGENYTYTLTGYAWDLVKPSELGGGECLNKAVDSNFAAEIELYEYQINACSQGTMEFDKYGSTTYVEQGGRFRIRHRQRGQLEPLYEKCGDDNAYKVAEPPGYPQRVSINYVAGMPRKADGTVKRPFADAVVYLALSRLQCDLPHCNECNDCVESMLEGLRKYPQRSIRDLSVSGQGGENREVWYRAEIPDALIRECEFQPITRGGVMAWHTLRRANIPLRHQKGKFVR